MAKVTPQDGGPLSISVRYRWETRGAHSLAVGGIQIKQLRFSIFVLCFFRALSCCLMGWPKWPLHSIFGAAPGAGGVGALLWPAWHMGGLLLALFGHGLSGGPGAPFGLGWSSKPGNRMDDPEAKHIYACCLTAKAIFNQTLMSSARR